MLSIIGASCNEISVPGYDIRNSIPDACIHNNETAILIEAKTQSPLIRQQLDAHIRTYLGSATSQRIITWEDIGERFAGLEGDLESRSKFLV